MIKKKSFFGVIVACIAILVCAGASSQSRKKSVNDTNRIIGVWSIVSPALPENNDQKKIKIITKGHFIWMYTLGNRIATSLGGTCTFDGETYTENIEYGTPNMNSYYFGEKAVYKVKFEDNKMHISGGTGVEVFNEVWERVE